MPQRRQSSPVPLNLRTHPYLLPHTGPPPQRPPHNSRLQSSSLGASTPKTLWVARSLHQQMGMLVAPHFPNPVTSPQSTVSAAPAATTVPSQPVVLSATARHFHLQDLRNRHCAVLRPMAPCLSPAGYAAFIPASARPPHSPVSAHTQVGPHLSLFAAAPKRGASTALARTHLASVLVPVLFVDHSLSLCLPSYPWYVLAYPSHLGMATSIMQTVISCTINTVFQCFSGSQAHQHYRSDLWTVTCGHPSRSQ